MTRRITHGDVVAAARVLIGRDEAAWAWCGPEAVAVWVSWLELRCLR